jgi:hypothetical protein
MPKPKKRTATFRPVVPMNPAIELDAYEYLASNAEIWLDCVVNSIAQGYSPEEIYRHVLRQAGYHRFEIAKRCENAARYLMTSQDAG